MRYEIPKGYTVKARFTIGFYRYVIAIKEDTLQTFVFMQGERLPTWVLQLPASLPLKKPLQDNKR